MSLTPFEHRILWILASKPRGELVPLVDIIEGLYGGVTGKEPPKSNTIQVIIGRVRKKGYPGIRAVRGRGYTYQPVEERTI